MHFSRGPRSSHQVLVEQKKVMGGKKKVYMYMDCYFQAAFLMAPGCGSWGGYMMPNCSCSPRAGARRQPLPGGRMVGLHCTPAAAVLPQTEAPGCLLQAAPGGCGGEGSFCIPWSILTGLPAARAPSTCLQPAVLPSTFLCTTDASLSEKPFQYKCHFSAR